MTLETAIALANALLTHGEWREEAHPRDDAGKFADGGGGDSPPTQKWRDPPPARGKAGGAAGGYSAMGRTNTEVGDTAEAALQQFGLESLHPDDRRGPLDVTCCGGWAFEVKAVTTESSEYKIKMKGHELRGKERYARLKGLKPASMIVVMDYKKGEAHAYWRKGLGNYRLSNSPEWNYMGTAKVGKGRK